jgi:hypothetical protein
MKTKQELKIQKIIEEIWKENDTGIKETKELINNLKKPEKLLIAKLVVYLHKRWELGLKKSNVEIFFGKEDEIVFINVWKKLRILKIIEFEELCLDEMEEAEFDDMQKIKKEQGEENE